MSNIDNQRRSMNARNNFPIVRDAVETTEPITYEFSNQPRYIKFLVLCTFPIYGTCRLGWKGLTHVVRKTWDLGITVIDTCATLYKVCKNIYNAIAPIIWNRFIRPFIYIPINRFFVTPIVTIIRRTFDTFMNLSLHVLHVIWNIFSRYGYKGLDD